MKTCNAMRAYESYSFCFLHAWQPMVTHDKLNFNKDTFAKYFLSFPTGLENNWIPACLLAHWVNENENLLPQQENLIVPGYRTAPL